jgi:hypothetical protein
MGNGTRIRKSGEHEKASSRLKSPALHQNRFGNAYEGSDREKIRGGILAGRIPIGARVFHVKGHGRVVMSNIRSKDVA